MYGLTLFGACLIGMVLVAGQRYFPDHVVMWFASDLSPTEAWRPAILTALAGLVVAREHYDHVYLRMAWGMVGVGLLWASFRYFLDYPEFLFDTMFMLSASVCFMIATMQPAPEPLDVPQQFKRVIPGAAITYYARLRHPKDRLMQTVYMSVDYYIAGNGSFRFGQLLARRQGSLAAFAADTDYFDGNAFGNPAFGKLRILTV